MEEILTNRAENHKGIDNSKVESRIRSLLETPMTRRNFLRNAAVVSISLPIVAKAFERSMYEGVAQSLLYPEISDSVVEVTKRLGARLDGIENPSFRPMTAIISEGINSYEKSGGKAFYEKNSNFKNIEEYSKDVRNFFEVSKLKDPRLLMEEMISNMDESTKDAYLFSDHQSSTFAQIFPKGSGYYNRLVKSNPNIVKENGQVNAGSFYGAALIAGPMELASAHKYIEQSVLESRGPVSASKCLEYYLSLNEGDLGASIFDTTIFLRSMARNNPQTGTDDPNAFNESWYLNNIKDEYQGRPYTDSGDQPIINLIGKPYHSWNLVSLMKYFPVEMIQAGGINRQLLTMNEQGLTKTRGDLETLSDLRDIEVLFDQYSN